MRFVLLSVKGCSSLLFTALAEMDWAHTNGLYGSLPAGWPQWNHNAQPKVVMLCNRMPPFPGVA